MKRSVSDLNDSTSGGGVAGLKTCPSDLSIRSDRFFSAQTSLNSTVTGKCLPNKICFTFLSFLNLNVYSGL